MTTLPEQLAALSAAEDFFALLGVAYEPQVLNVKRLHILKRYRERLAAAGAAEGEEALLAHHRAALEGAYQDLLPGEARERKLFKVFQEPAPEPPRFVPLTALASGPPRRS
jgi:nitrogenase-stabilizing/protective protein